MTDRGEPPTGGMRVLVTGGAGFVGSHIVEELRALNWPVEALDNLSTGSRTNLAEGVTLHEADIRNETAVRSLFAAGRFDAVIHCAAQTSVERSMKDPGLDREINVAGTQNLLSAARATGVRRFVFFSSGGAIYGDTKTPATESDMPAPRSHYGLHKLAGEELVRASGLPYTILRPSNVYGSRQRMDLEGGVIAIFHSRLSEGLPLDIHGEGRQIRDFVHTSDVVSAALLSLTWHEDTIWNVSTGQPATILQLAEVISQAMDLPLDLRERPRRAGDVDVSVLDPSRLLATGAWGPPIPLSQGLHLVARNAAANVQG